MDEQVTHPVSPANQKLWEGPRTAQPPHRLAFRCHGTRMLQCCESNSMPLVHPGQIFLMTRSNTCSTLNEAATRWHVALRLSQASQQAAAEVARQCVFRQVRGCHCGRALTPVRASA